MNRTIVRLTVLFAALAAVFARERRPSPSVGGHASSG